MRLVGLGDLEHASADEAVAMLADCDDVREPVTAACDFRSVAA